MFEGDMPQERCPKCGSVKQEGTGFYDCGTAQSGNSIPCEQSKLCYTRQQARQELLAEVIGKLEGLEVFDAYPCHSGIDIMQCIDYGYLSKFISELKTLQGDSDGE